MTSIPDRLILRDEGTSCLSLFETRQSRARWQTDVPAGRNLFLLSPDRLILGTGSGFEIRQAATGALLDAVESHAGTIAVSPGRDGSLILSAIETVPEASIVLRTLALDGTTLRELRIPGYSYVRIVTALKNGGFVLTANTEIFEVSADGQIIWKSAVRGHAEPHAWQTIRLASGVTILSAGYAASLQAFDERGQLIHFATAPAGVNPVFFAGIQLLDSGHFLVANWQGHGLGLGESGFQVLLFDAKLTFIEAWKQPAARFSSIQGVWAVSA